MRTATAAAPRATSSTANSTPAQGFDFQDFADLIEGHRSHDVLPGTLATDRHKFAEHVFAALRADPPLLRLPLLDTAAYRLADRLRDLEIRPDLPTWKWMREMSVHDEYRKLFKILFAIRQRHLEEKQALEVMFVAFGEGE